MYNTHAYRVIVSKCHNGVSPCSLHCDCLNLSDNEIFVCLCHSVEKYDILTRADRVAVSHSVTFTQYDVM